MNGTTYSVNDDLRWAQLKRKASLEASASAFSAYTAKLSIPILLSSSNSTHAEGI